MTQKWLPGFDGSHVEERPAPSDDRPERAASWPWPVPVLPGQFALFTPARELVGLMEGAVLEGRFEEALQHRRALEERDRASRDAGRMRLLDCLGDAAFWARPLDACVEGWLELERGWDAEPHVRALVLEGVLRRLVGLHGPLPVIRCSPSFLVTLVNLLGRQAGAGQASARAVMRDALAEGLTAPPGEFDDGELRGLLAEDRAPRWLACLGALRRLWPVPPLPASETNVVLPPLAEDDGARGGQFWLCLRLAVSFPRHTFEGIEARKRMRLLDAGLHAEFMSLGVQPG